MLYNNVVVPWIFTNCTAYAFWDRIMLVKTTLHWKNIDVNHSMVPTWTRSPSHNWYEWNGYIRCNQYFVFCSHRAFDVEWHDKHLQYSTTNLWWFPTRQRMSAVRKNRFLWFRILYWFVGMAKTWVGVVVDLPHLYIVVWWRLYSPVTLTETYA